MFWKEHGIFVGAETRDVAEMNFQNSFDFGDVLSLPSSIQSHETVALSDRFVR